MKKLPKDIVNIVATESIFYGNDYFHFYIINKGEKDETRGYSISNYDINDKIIDTSNPFINGFKVVKTENEKYAYVSEQNLEILSPRYDIASNFNEYGLAMVAKNGRVYWINKKFENIKTGTLISDGWDEIHEFSKGSIPLSRVHNSKCSFPFSYIDTDGKIKEFYCYDSGDLVTSFMYGNNFNEFDFAIDQKKIMFADGFYCRGTLNLTDANLDIIFEIKNGIENSIKSKQKTKKLKR